MKNQSFTGTFAEFQAWKEQATARYTQLRKRSKELTAELTELDKELASYTSVLTKTELNADPEKDAEDAILNTQPVAIRKAYTFLKANPTDPTLPKNDYVRARHLNKRFGERNWAKAFNDLIEAGYVEQIVNISQGGYKVSRKK